MTRPEAALIDELEFRSYVHNRKTFPSVAPARWALIFSNVLAMEERLSTGNILDVADRGNATSVRIGSLCVGDEGVSGTVEGHGRVGSGLDAKPSAATNSVHAGQPSENQASPADSQILDRHGDDRFADNIQRALEGLPQNGDAEEELAAAEEGAAIEASNMPYPEYERNGR